MNGFDVKSGDTVIRILAGHPSPMIVTEITKDTIHCGAWTFDKRTGAEIDKFLNWGPSPLFTGSFLLFGKVNEA